MFPTRSKNKIPRSLTYPLRAKTISEALADVPQADELKLWFSNYRTPSELLKQTIYSLVTVGYSHRAVDQFTPHDVEETGRNDPKWSIQIYAVPVEIRARVTQLLQDEALPRLRTWLLSRADVAQLRSCRIEVIYDEPADHLKFIKHET